MSARRIVRRDVETVPLGIRSKVFLECGHAVTVECRRSDGFVLRYAWDGEDERGRVKCGECESSG